jgi:hypothetical protein
VTTRHIGGSVGVIPDFFVAQRKAEDPVAEEVEIPAGQCHHCAGGHRWSLDEVWPDAAHGGEWHDASDLGAVCGF